LEDIREAWTSDGHRTQVGGSLPKVALPTALAGATYNADNQLTNWAGTTLGYDANGNLTSDGTSTYAWNARGQLTTIAAGSTTTAAYAYDPLGRRVSRTIAGSTTGFAYNGSTAVQEKSGSTVTANSIVGGTDQVLSRTDSAGARSYLTDGLNSTLALVDSTGAIQTSYAYTPYGATTASGATSTNAAQYTGRENDANGLYYYRARYYNPTTGRFISEDPLGLAAGPNVYAYAADDPVDLNDPSGMFLPILGVLAAGCAGGAALAVFTDAATVVSGWFGDFVGGLFGAPPLPHRKVTLGGVLGDALVGCALGAASVGLLELITLLRPAAEVPLGEAGGGGGASQIRQILSGLRAGNSSNVWEAATPQELNQIFDKLSQGGTTVTGSTYPGRLVRLPDGMTVGLRDASKSGGPTIDIFSSGQPTIKIHLPLGWTP
jgi:RHS repeat-associated protein